MPARQQDVEYFGVEVSLSVVVQMMNREAGDDAIELPQRRQFAGEVMSHDRNVLLAREAFSRRVQHGVREVDCYKFGLRTGCPYQSQQSSIPSSNIKNALRSSGHEFEQRSFAFNAVWNGIGTAEILQGMLGRRPEIDVATRTHPAIVIYQLAVKSSMGQWVLPF